MNDKLNIIFPNLENKEEFAKHLAKLVALAAHKKVEQDKEERAAKKLCQECELLDIEEKAIL